MKANPSRARLELEFSLDKARSLHSEIRDLFGKSEMLPLCTNEQIEVVAVIDTSNPVGAFKIRGAYGILDSLVRNHPDPEKLHVIAASSGSFGMSLACVADFLKIRSSIFVPETIPASKLSKIKKFGGNVQVIGSSYEESKKNAKAFAKSNACDFVDGVGPEVFYGNASLGLEILDYLESQQTGLEKKVAVILPLGIGSLLIPLRLVFQHSPRPIDLIVVEPQSHAKLEIYIENSCPSFINTIADGAAVREFPEQVEKLVLNAFDYYDKIDDSRTISTMKKLHNDFGIKIEGAAALPFASIGKNIEQLKQYDLLMPIATGNNYPDNFYDT